jgi:hypothetical protein
LVDEGVSAGSKEVHIEVFGSYPISDVNLINVWAKIGWLPAKEQ